MAIRNSITKMRSGIVGTLSYDGPTRALGAILDSSDEDLNVFGSAFTYKTEGTVQAGGAGVFAGIMTNPHAYAIDTAELKNGKQAEFLHMGEGFVHLVPAVFAGKTAVVPAIGSKVYFVVATGELTVDPDNQDTSPIAHTEIKGAAVSRHTPVADSNGHVATISLTGLQV